MSTTTGYRLSDFSDRQREFERLKSQADIIAALEERAYAELELPTQGRGLDVGCGPGFVSQRIQSRWPGLRMTGVDLDGDSLQHARHAFEAVRADASMLPFQSGVFDLAFTRLLLRHIPRPERAVAELIRVVRPGGMVLVEDCDDGSLVLEPYPAGFAEALAARHASLRRRGAEPMLARRLPAMLRRTGLVSVALRAVVVSTEDIGANAFARIVLGPATEAIDADLLEDSQVLAARQSIAAWSESAVAFGMTTLLILRGFRA